MNRDNLKKLADYLAALPQGYKEFSMYNYFKLKPTTFRFLQSSMQQWRDSNEASARYATDKCNLSECGAVACAVGHGPAAGIPFTDGELEHLRDGIYANWRKYTEANFCQVLDGSNEPQLEFYWMFGGRWAEVDNTPQGAAARIYYLLDGNEVPQKIDGYGYPDIILDSSIYQEYVK